MPLHSVKNSLFSEIYLIPSVAGPSARTAKAPAQSLVSKDWNFKSAGWAVIESRGHVLLLERKQENNLGANSVETTK